MSNVHTLAAVLTRRTHKPLTHAAAPRKFIKRDLCASPDRPFLIHRFDTILAPRSPHSQVEMRSVLRAFVVVFAVATLQIGAHPSVGDAAGRSSDVGHCPVGRERVAI
ncbi:hypothetical protein CBOM_00615 [Ceraceosorus bombacis]|uniref:Uncharacterized protein n=1 Tax=Ceraceosorus bombacis TaxID=401625 RepID=A0A0P1BBK2_9BASI|nr:hypothetical protein CBOM_00615 [Ceraceosorus bombacis]